MNKIQEILHELQSTSSKIDKLEILGENVDNKNFKTILELAYNKIEKNYYVKKLPELEYEGEKSIDNLVDLKEIEIMFMVLSMRERTGHSALEYIKETLEKFDGSSQDIIINIFARDLKAGFSESSINKAIPGLIPVFDVALAKSYSDHQKKVEIGAWLASRKLDGVRCIAIRNRNSFNFFSRKGKPFTTLDKLIPELLDISGDNMEAVYDGEICLTDKDGNEDFTGIMKQIKKKDHTIPNPKYKLFDYLTKEEFYSQTSERILSERLDTLRESMDYMETGSSIGIMCEQLEQLPFNEQTFAHLQDQVEKFGWEGLILRKDDIYIGKRTHELLKVKKFFDDEYTVLDVENGPYQFTAKGTGQLTEDMMTAVIIEHKGYEVNVGSGFSLNERREFFKNPGKIIGKTITVQYFEQTTNKQGTVSLRFPTVKHIHGKKRDT